MGLSFDEWSNQKKKGGTANAVLPQSTQGTSFDDWSNQKHGVVTTPTAVSPDASLRTTDRDAFDSAVRKNYQNSVTLPTVSEVNTSLANRRAELTEELSILSNGTARFSDEGKKRIEEIETELESLREQEKEVDKAIQGDRTTAELHRDAFLYGAGKVGTGLLGVGEAINDAVGSTFYTLVGAGADLVGADKAAQWSKDKAASYLDNSITKELNQKLEEKYKPTNSMQFAGNVNETVSAMLPGIGASKVVAGAGNALNAVNQAQKGANVGKAVFGLQSMGGSAQDAKNAGATTGEALIYGAASGLLETTIEGIAGGIPGMGGGKVQKIADALNANPTVSKILDIVGEGGEEALSTFVTPYLQRAIYDENAANATAEEIAQSAAMGMIASGILQTGFTLPSYIQTKNAQTVGNAENSPVTPPNGVLPTSAPVEQKTAPSAVNGVEAVKPKITMADFANIDSPIWNNVAYEDTETRRKIQEQAHQEMVDSNEVVSISEETLKNVAEHYPDLRSMKKKERTPILNQKIRELRDALGAFLDVIKGNTYEFEVNGNILDAKLYDTGIREVKEKITQSKASMLYGTEEIFKNARYLYSTGDKTGDPNVYRWNYFYTPVKIGEETVGVRIAVRDIANPAESQIYNWGIKKDATLDGEGRGKSRISLDVSSVASTSGDIVTPEGAVVNNSDTESVGAAPSGFDPYSNMISQYGIIPEGENPARMVDLPKSTNGEDRVSYSARTVMEAQATPEAMLGDIANAVLSGELSHEVNTDAAAMERARNTVTDKGWEGAKETFHQMARKGVVSKDAVALGQILLNNAMNSGDAASTIDILTDYASMSTTAAQSLQAQRMLKKLTPEGQLYGIQRSVKNLQEELTERYKDKAPNLEIPENLVQNFLKAQDQDARDSAMAEIYKNVASQVPSTWMDKWNAWRYMSMLTNPRTHVRNIAGNLGFAPVRMVKNAIATTIETAVDAVLPGGIQRTKAALNIASKEDRALIVAALKDVANVKGQLEGSGKYSDNAASQIDEYRRIFKNPLLEGVRKGNTAAMTAEDTLFSAPAYAGALAGYLKANGVSAQSVTEGTVDGSVLDAARSYAVKEAQKATYRDQNAFSDFVSNLHYKGDNKVGQAVDKLVEGVLPFRRTPANILVRGVEYSPAGLVKSLTYDMAQLVKGNKTAAEVIDSAAAGLTGTGLLALGVYLASQGLVSGGSSGDEEKDAMADLTGGQNYAVSIDGKNYTLDWLAPEALPFFVGVEAYNTLSDNSEEGVTLDVALSALNRIADPVLEMSMLQGVQDLIETVQYAEGGTLIKVAANAAISYLTQAIPTLFGQIERTTEGERETTFVDRTSGIPRDIQYTIGKAANKLYGEFQQIPYIDAWGRTESSGTAGERAFNNFLNPSYTSVENETKADKEINRLIDAGYTGIAPDRVSQSQKVDGEYMNSEQYVEYATTKGRTAYDIVDDMIASDFYKGLTDEEKANVLSLAYTYAGHIAAEEITNGKHESEKYVELAQQAQKDLGLSEAEYLMYYKMYGGTTMNSDSLREAYDAGIGIETFIDYKEAISGLTADKDKDGKTISGSKKAKVVAEINELNIPPDAKDYLYLSAGYSEKELNNTPWH